MTKSTHNQTENKIKKKGRGKIIFSTKKGKELFGE